MKAQVLLSSLALDVQESWTPVPRSGCLTDLRDADDIIEVDQVDELLSSGSVRYPQFRLVIDGIELDRRSYTRDRRMRQHVVDGLIKSGPVREHWDAGAVIAIQNLQDFWPPLARVCDDFTAILGHPVRVNSYLAPPHCAGLGLHHDSHDNLVLQIDGQRQWEVFATETRQPESSGVPGFVLNRAGYERAVRGARPAVDTELRRGDMLFIPAGCPHSAQSGSEASLHVTFGIHRLQRRDLAMRLVELVASMPTFMEPLPPVLPGRVFDASIEETVAMLLDELRRADAKTTMQDLAAAVPVSSAGENRGLFASAFQAVRTGTDADRIE